MRTYLPGMNEEREETQANFIQQGKQIKCGHCEPDKYAVAPIPCKCICHTPSKDTREWSDRFDEKFRAGEFDLTYSEQKEMYQEIKDFIRKEISLAYQQGYEDGLPCSCHPEGHTRECVLYPEK